MRTVLGGLGLMLVAGCSSADLCSADCPKLEGSWAMSYEALSVESPDCSGIPPPAGPATIEITRGGAELRATLLGNPGRGMLQDSSDFSITALEAPDGGADAGSQSLTLRGYFIPPTQRADGGEPARIVGKWITHTERGAKICDAERPVSGLRQ